MFLLVLPLSQTKQAIAADTAPDNIQPQVQSTTEHGPVSANGNFAPRFQKAIDPDQASMPLPGTDKLKFAVREQMRWYAFGTQILAAGWSHLLDSDPRYGTDKAGFGERLGAAAIRQSSQSLFADGVLATAFREDPRYYRKGSGRVLNRAVYAATRVLVTRSDSGVATPNYSELFGYAGAAALTMTYYPAVSATWPRTGRGYVLSLGASALGNEAYEFAPNLIHLVFHHHKGSSGK